MAAAVVVPRAIRRVENQIEIEWNATHTGVIPLLELRLACPCARCVDEISGRPLLDPKTVPAEVQALEIAPVGAYGIRILWSDGHGSGIFTYGMLLAGCRCPACHPGG